MSSVWPDGVTTLQDMYDYARTLFGGCEIEDLLEGTEFDKNYSGCFLIRVKGACDQGDWKKWPDLIEDAMQTTVKTHGKRCHASDVQS